MYKHFMSGHTKMHGQNRRAAVMGIISPDNKEIHIGYSMCSEKDQFSRKFAREKIAERISEGKGFKVNGDFTNEREAKMAVLAIFEVLKSNPSVLFKPYQKRVKKVEEVKEEVNPAMFT